MASEKGMTLRAQKAADRKRQLLQSAKTLFSSKGYHNTPVREITKQIGMADGLIYHYYPGGKLEMLKAIFEEGFSRTYEQTDRLFSQMPENLSFEEAVFYFCKSIENKNEYDQEFVRLFIRERDVVEGVEQMMLSMFGKMWRLTHDWLKARHASGELKSINFKYGAHVIMSTVAGIYFMDFLQPDLSEEDFDTYVSEYINFTMGSWKN